MAVQPPPGWGHDSLSRFIEMARRNKFATFVQARPIWNCLNEIDSLFRLAIDAMNNSRAWFAGFLLLRSHASYLGGVRLSVSGQLTESYMVLRGCLESALYGLFIHENPGLRQLWLSRHESAEAKNRVKAEFRIGPMFDLLDARDIATGGPARELYERTIDYGAHPNELALLTALRLTDERETVRFDLNYLSDNSTPALALCLKTTAQVGVCALRMFRLVIPERFDLLSISDALARLSAGL